MHTGRAQAEQRARPGRARAAARQAPDPRRDRRRPARRRDRHRLRALRPRVRRLHGQPRTCAGRRRTSSGCACSAPRCGPVEFGTKTLKEATSEAIRDWIANVETTYYLIGSCVGPAPYPELVRELQRVIGREAREQILARRGPAARRGRRLRRRRLERDRHVLRLHPRRGRAPDRRRGGRRRVARHAAAPGVLHGARSSVLADDDGQIVDAHSISAGLDYPGVGPEHAYLRDSGRAEYVPCTDDEALAAFHRLCETEGIVPALESSHALARARSTSTPSSSSSASRAAATRISPRCWPPTGSPGS